MSKSLWTSIVATLADAAQEHPPLAAELLRLFSVVDAERVRQAATRVPTEQPLAAKEKLDRLVQFGIGADSTPAGTAEDRPPLDTRLELAAEALRAGRKEGNWFDAFDLPRLERDELTAAYEAASIAATALATLPTFSDGDGVGATAQSVASVQRWLYDRVAAFGARCPLQGELFLELSRFAKQSRVYVARHMRVADACSADEFEMARIILARPSQGAARGQRAASRSAETKQLMECRETPGAVLEARDLLHGQRALLVGGDEREHQRRAIEDSLGVTLRWLPTRAHESTQPAINAVSSADIVFLAIRWAGHAYSELATVCRQHGVPLVRLPAGLNPAQLALQTLEQAGDRLRLASEAT